MPMYEYRCSQCGAAFEKIVSFSQADAVPCPQCGHTYVQRRISQVAQRMNSGVTGNLSSSSCDTSTGGSA